MLKNYFLWLTLGHMTVMRTSKMIVKFNICILLCPYYCLEKHTGNKINHNHDHKSNQKAGKSRHSEHQ